LNYGLKTLMVRVITKLFTFVSRRTEAIRTYKWL